MLKEAFILHLFYFVLDVRTAVRCYRRHFLAHPAAKATAEGRLVFCLCFFYLKNIFNDFTQTNYLNICQTDFRQICKVGKTMAID